MERFAFKIDKSLKANLYKICRLCGIDNPDKVDILAASNSTLHFDDSEPELWKKIYDCVGFIVSKEDRMPQTICSLCVDKINDFFEFREMCFATNAQTRKLLGLKPEAQPQMASIEDFDDKRDLSIAVSKRAPLIKGKRKRRAEEMLEKTTIKVDVEEIKEERPTSSTASLAMRKKTKLTNSPSAADAVSTASLGITSMLKKAKALTPMQKRAMEQVEKKLKSKEEIKREMFDANELTSSASKYITNSSLASGRFRQHCGICNQRFANKSQLDRHQHATHLPNIPRYICTGCNETIKKNVDIKNHQLWHKLSKTPFICGLCGEALPNSYAYSRHLRDHTAIVPTALLVLNRQCPQCQQTFVTNYLYNIHPCSVQTKMCGGCNRYQKNDYEYMRHAPFCPKTYINYSKHITVASGAEESAVRIKNENDVEAAAAAEALESGVSGNAIMALLSLTRLPPPLQMQSNQCVVIPGDQLSLREGSPLIPTTSNTKIAKKNSKKGVLRKDLKRVDELLKSTMDTLVSIKHEPEVHMDTCEEMPETLPVLAQLNENIDGHEVEEKESSPSAGDNFHNDSDNTFDGESLLSGITIKQEVMDDSEKSLHFAADLGTVNIKQEPTDPNKIPVLKLKIVKEHGKLNTSIVQQEDSSKIEKKKKKKKRKDVDKEKSSDENHEYAQSYDISMPQTGSIRIKQERMDDSTTGIAFTTIPYNHEEHEHMSTTGLMTETLPLTPSFQISCVSSGVNFHDDGILQASTLSSSTTDMEDVKPCRQTLDRLLQIANVSGGVEMMSEEDHNDDESLDKSANCISRKSNTTAVKSTCDVPRNSNNATSSSGLPRILAISSGDDVLADVLRSSAMNPEPLVVKKERLDADYGDIVSATVECSTDSNSVAKIATTEELPASSDSVQLSEEQKYIENIDFNNIIIKQERDIEVSEVELNETALNFATLHERETPQRKRELNNAATQKTSEVEMEDVSNENESGGEFVEPDEEEGEDEEDEEDDDDDDEEYNNNEMVEMEDREYREMDLPPMLELNEMPSESGDSARHEEATICDSIVQTAVPINPLTLIISNVVSEATAPTTRQTEVATPSVDNASDYYYPSRNISLVPSVSEANDFASDQRGSGQMAANVAVTDTLRDTMAQGGDGSVTAVSFCVPPIAAPSTGALCADAEATDSDEEQQNQLNQHSLTERHVVTSEISNDTTSLPTLSPDEPSLKALTLRIFDASRCNSGTTPHIEEPPTTSQFAAALVMPNCSEETENLINESNDAAARFQTNGTLLMRQQAIAIHAASSRSLLLDDESNINEIAENNNNANIERELQEDSASAGSAEARGDSSTNTD